MKEVGSHGRTIVFVSHNLNAIGSLCTSAMVLAKGSAVYFSHNIQEALRQFTGACAACWKGAPDFTGNLPGARTPILAGPILGMGKTGAHRKNRRLEPLKLLMESTPLMDPPELVIICRGRVPSPWNVTMKVRIKTSAVFYGPAVRGIVTTLVYQLAMRKTI
jgi:hypothetical protein